MSRTSRTESSDALVLRTAAVWGTFVLASRDLRAGQSLRLGDGEDALYAKPDQSPVADLPIIAVGRGWELDATGATGGSLQLRGRAEDPCALGKTGAPIPIVAGDHGLLQYGTLSVFFQFAHPAPPLKQGFRLDLPLVLAFVFALLTIGGSLLLLYMLFPEQPLAKPLELTSARELEVRYHFTPPPPEEPSSGAEAEAGSAGAQSKRPAAAAGSAKRPPGPAQPSRLPSAAGAGTPLGSSAMLEVMQGSVGREVLESLGTISSVSAALGGLSSAGLVLGGQSGGSGLRASAGGGGQDGSAVFGSGTLNTGFGSGAGVAGNARGRAGSGKGDGTGAGRGGERRIAAAAGVASGQGLSPEQISRVVHARSGAFRACYESAAARDPKLQGGVTVSFSVSPAGSVTARIANSSLANARVESCVLRMFNRLRFPAAERATSANWPLVFRPGK
jgi:hypothetical protein